MRFLTPEQAISRLQSEKNVARTLYLDKMANHISDAKPLPVEVKTMVYAAGMAGLKQGQISDLFNIPPSTVGAIERGNKTTRGGSVEIVDQELRDKVIDPLKDNIVTKATDLVMAALEKAGTKIGDEKNKLRDLSGAAKDFSAIIEHISPKAENGNLAAVILVGTHQYSEDRYKVIDIPAKVG